MKLDSYRDDDHVTDARSTSMTAEGLCQTLTRTGLLLDWLLMGRFY